MSSSIQIIGIDAAIAAIDAKIAQIQAECELAISEAVDQTYDESQARVAYDNVTKHDDDYMHLKDSAVKEVDGLQGSLTYGTDHVFYVEHGTSRMAAQPFLNPSFEIAKGPFIQKCQDAAS
jgi:HK97 gp10 family phage protein